MKSDKPAVSNLCSILKQKGIKHIVLCPGSRNAPIIASITDDPFFTCYSIVDERSAGFFALGIGQMIKSTVAVVCTSGTAVLNLAPAVAEAYYQRIPLLVISSDRPKEWVNQGESQTLNQANIFTNFIRKSFDLIQEPKSKNELWYQNREISEAINATMLPFFGPVHLNMRFEEPLYESGDEASDPKIIREITTKTTLSEKEISDLKKEWNACDKIMVVCGQMFPDKKLRDSLVVLAKNGVVVLTESTSNLDSDEFFNCIDKVIIPSSKEQIEKLKPNLLITIGGPLISRKIKTYLREAQIDTHWHIDPIDQYMDGYQHQSLAIKLPADVFVKHISHFEKKKLNFLHHWRSTNDYVERKHSEFIESADFSDLSIFAELLKLIPEGALLHVANSSAIRYVQLFNVKRSLECYGNRGTSGIEGSVSTAVGASTINRSDTYLITGDLSMMYDSNGLWNNYINPKLKIIVINNSGGGIFRILDGPSKIPESETYIETVQDRNFEGLALMHDVAYYLADDKKSLNTGMKLLKEQSERAFLLEIKSPRETNDKVIMDYFEHLKTKE